MALPWRERIGVRWLPSPALTPEIHPWGWCPFEDGSDPPIPHLPAPSCPDPVPHPASLISTRLAKGPGNYSPESPFLKGLAQVRKEASQGEHQVILPVLPPEAQNRKPAPGAAGACLSRLCARPRRSLPAQQRLEGLSVGPALVPSLPEPAVAEPAAIQKESSWAACAPRMSMLK